MSFFKFNKNPDRALRNHPLLAGRKLIGKGMFSGVFEGDDNTVYKITSDPATRDFYRELCVVGDPFFPTLVADHDKIADDAWLFQLERLTPIQRYFDTRHDHRRSTDVRLDTRPESSSCIGASVDGYGKASRFIRALQALADEVEDTQGVSLRHRDRPRFEAYILHWASLLSEFEPHGRALRALSELVEDRRYHLDLKTNNFMLRGEALVFNDPVTNLFCDH